MNDSEKEANQIFDKIMDSVDNDGRLSLDCIPIIAEAIEYKRIEIDRLTKLKNDFKSEIERLTKENNERFDLIIELQKRITDLKQNLDVALKAGEAWKKEALKMNVISPQEPLPSEIIKTRKWTKEEMDALDRQPLPWEDLKSCAKDVVSQFPLIYGQPVPTWIRNLEEVLSRFPERGE